MAYLKRQAATITNRRDPRNAPYPVECLVVGGGGAGGCDRGGGGGAGGMRESVEMVQPGLVYLIIVGAGGTASVNVTAEGYDSCGVNQVRALPGGWGGNDPGDVETDHGGNGGSGGGASSIGAAVNGLGTAGQGYAGGAARGTLSGKLIRWGVLV